MADYAHCKATVAELYRRGVPVLAGTDANTAPGSPMQVPHGISLHHELELLVEAGLTPVDAVRAATVAPARTFGLADRGRVAPGLRADLVLIDGDPTVDITSTRALRAVWCAGRRFDPPPRRLTPTPTPRPVPDIVDRKEEDGWTTRSAVPPPWRTSGPGPGRLRRPRPSDDRVGRCLGVGDHRSELRGDQLAAGWVRPDAGLEFVEAASPAGRSPAAARRAGSGGLVGTSGVRHPNVTGDLCSMAMTVRATRRSRTSVLARAAAW